MKAPSPLSTALLCVLLGGAALPGLGQISETAAQVPLAATAPTPVPALIPYAGLAVSPEGKPLAEPVSVTFLIYKDRQGGEALWNETETVTPDEVGKFSVQLGSTLPGGLPADLFANGEARWLEVQIAGQEPKARTLLTSVPYAMKSADAESLAGHAVSDFVTQEQLAQLAQSSAQSGQKGAAAPDSQPNSGGTVTGTGTAGTVPLWTGALTQGNSLITQVGSNIGINQPTPRSTLDVGGSLTVRANMFMPPMATATVTAGQRSNIFEFQASAWSSTANAAQIGTFKEYVAPTGNNTASPAATLRFGFQNGAGVYSDILGIASNGVISFAPSQTFPGTIKSVAAASPVTATTTSGAVSLGLNTSALETRLNSVYPQLGAYNTFTSGATFGGETTLTGSSTDWMLVATNAGAGKGTILGQAVGTSTGVEGASPGGIGVEGASDTGSGVFAVSNTTGIALQAVANGTGPAGTFWSQSGSASVQAINKGAGAAFSASAGNAYGGSFTNSSTTQATVYASNAGDGNAGSFNNNSASRVALAGFNASTDGNAIGTYGNVPNGKAVYGVSSTGNGVYGISTNGVAVVGNSTAAAGVAGYSSSGSGTYGSTTSGIGAIGISSSNVGVNGISTSGTGVFGQTGTLSTTGASSLALNYFAGVYGDAGQAGNGSANNFGVLGTADDSFGGYFVNNSATLAPLASFNYNSGGPNAILNLFQASSPNGTCGFGGAGNLSCTGQIKSLVDAAGGTRKVETYAMQSPENWMEDFGSGELKNGAAVVTIDPAFAETVTGDSSYHVFITPNGDSAGLYVIKKTPTSFEVRESKGGTSSLSFDYRIVAKRRGFEVQRLTDVTERFRTETMHARPPADAHAPQGLAASGQR